MGTQSKSALVRIHQSIALLMTIVTVIALSGVTAAEAATLTLKVVSARTEPAHVPPVVKGAVISPNAYKYIINIDNTGQTTQRSPADGCSPGSAGYPGSCLWTSIAGTNSASPIYTQGDQADFPLLNLPNGRYLVSVLADGYKLDGRHFTVSGANITWQGKPAGDPAGQVTVELQPHPMPDATIQAAVFEDISPVNGAPDLPAEHGLAGFQGHIVDYLGEVTTDVYGDPLCGNGICLSACYVVNGGVDLGTVAPIDAAGRCPLEPPPGWPAGAVIEGKIKIPNLGTNRYSLSVTPPNGSGWIQTTTLEGNHDWDAWVMEGATGLDTEFIIAGEPFPAIIFGYVKGTPNAYGTLSGSGTVKGVVDAVKVYIPMVGGVGGLPGDTVGCCVGARIDKPIQYPWVTLTSLTNGDTIVWAGQGNVNGAFSIPNVPVGDYTITWWDEDQNYILDLTNITVGPGETVDMGILPLAGWWTFFDGYVFNDLNKNGIKDPGEPGLPGYGLTMRKRENSLMDRGTVATTTDATGYYKFEAAYPMTQWLVMEAYDDLHYTTGVTYQADNQPAPTTHIGAGVDVSVLPIIGLSGRLDWGKRPYDPTGVNGPRNGGIVGSLSYDTTRNELDPRFAAAEDWQPGIPDLTVNLYAPVACPAVPPVTGCDASGRYVLAADGSFLKGNLLNNYLSETWQRPTGCVARNVDNNPLVHGTDEQVLPLAADAECLEGPLMGIQFGTYATDQGTPDANFGAAVNGNYGFGDGCFVTVTPFVPGVFNPATGECTTGSFLPLPGGRDYLVEVEIPNDSRGVPLYKVTREEDINIANGDPFIPPAVPPPECAGPLHTVDDSGNATFLDIGGSPYNGMQKPLCTVKLVPLANGKSVVPMFNLYTDVPIPGRFWGLIVDDLNFSADPKSLLYGEKAGVPFVPVGVYDYSDRLVVTVESDFNGLFDVLLPSTNRISCPTPSGVCANLYRLVGNDPGVPGRLNLNYNPQFRTIAAEFEVFPGLIVPADLAPTQVGVSVQLPGGQPITPITCNLDPAQPQLYAVSKPLVRSSDTGTARRITISGAGFGSAAGTVTYADMVPATNLNVVGWTNSAITVDIPTSPTGPHQLKIAAASGQSTVNGITIHVLTGTGSTSGSGVGTYDPRVYEVGPGRTYAPAETLPTAADHAIQRALDAAATGTQTRGNLVVVYPNTNTPANPRQNPRGAYYENLIISGSVKLQGVGPGSPDGSVRGAIIDGGAFAGDSPVATDWYAKIGTLTWAGNQTIYDGAVISIFPSTATTFPSVFSATTAPRIDGFDLRGGDQAGFPGNINPIGGGPTGAPPGVITQGGAIFANGYARNLQITNNVVQNNGGAYGTIRIGTPDLPAPDTNNENDGVRIMNNRVVANGGTNLAGGIGLFNGSDGYEVANNDICGNFSAEYGGGVSALGSSPGGKIHHNRIYFNRSYDEGGGIMIAGSLPANTSTLSPGSGAVDIYNNLIQANMANDDGGGIRFLMAGNFPMNVYNNFIVNNVSTHEGGGISLNDTPNVRVYNNTIMGNKTTATAVGSTGIPAPAGLSTTRNSVLLQATLPGGVLGCGTGTNARCFSDPLLFNNIFWDNRAGTRDASTVHGLGLAGDASPIDYWDIGTSDGSGLLSPTDSVLQTAEGTNASVTNSVGVNPNVVTPYDIPVTFAAWRNNPAFIDALMVVTEAPPNLMGNFHLVGNASPAYNRGVSSKAAPAYQQPPASIAAPTTDFDGQARPANGGFDAGADEIPAAAPVSADLSITKTDGVTSVNAGGTVTYTIVVTKVSGPAVTGALVTDTLPATLTTVSWTCSASGTGASCPASGTGNISQAVNFGATGTQTVTFTVTGTVPTTASGGTLVNTATVAVPAGVTDPSPANNSATDSDTIVPQLPTLTVLDNFNRTNGSLGGNWSQVLSTAIQVNSNQAFCVNTGIIPPCLLGSSAYWNGTGNVFGAKQGAGFTFANTTSGSALVLKASGGSAAVPTSFLRVRYTGTAVDVGSTTNAGLSYASLGTFSGVTFALNDRLTAVANTDGSVDVWKTTAASVTTYLGHSATSASFTGTGRIGMQLLNGARVDDFRGGTVP